MRTVIVAGALANKPSNGGEAWVRLSWLLGLRRLGLDVWLFEQIDPAICVDERGDPASAECSVNRLWFERVVAEFGLTRRAALVSGDGGVIVGPGEDVLADVAAGAELLVNISGNLTVAALLAAPRRRAYLDLDPGYTQLWHRAGALGDALARHEDLLTVGLSIGAGASLPDDGLAWRAVPPPVIMEEWPLAPVKTRAITHERDLRLTTVASWRGGYGRVEHDGHLYGQKAHQFRRFATLPRESEALFEAALAIDRDDEADGRLLRDGGWRVVDPWTAAGDPDAFRDYVQGSAAEFSPAQGVYVETRCGWLGDRSARYLASGRPAIVQDTGLPEDFPIGEGLLTFGTPREALAAVEALAEDYDAHSRAARGLAQERLDSDRVLGSLLEDLLP